MNTTDKKEARGRIERWTLAVGVALLLSSANAFAVSDMCIDENDGVTGPPRLTDGDVAGDVGYTRGTRVDFGNTNGGTEHAGFLRVVEQRDADFVWVGLEIDRLASTVYSDDTIILGFSNDDGVESVEDDVDVMLIIRPFGLPPHSLDVPTDIAMRTRDAGSTTWTTVPTPGWVKTNIRRKFETGADKWMLELMVPKLASAAGVPATGIYFGEPISASNPNSTLKVYVNVLRSLDSIPLGSPYAITEASWPAGVYLQDITVLGDPLFFDLSSDFYDVLPPVNLWADVSLGDRSECEGISLAWNDIGATPDPKNKILLDGENTFFADPVHDPDSSGGPIKVTYKVARWGIPPEDTEAEDPGCAIGMSDSLCWRTIGTSSPDTARLPDAPGSETKFTVTWELLDGDRAAYSAERHQCIAATMSSTTPGVVFKNDSVRRNMNFGPASIFEQSASISGKGYGPATEANGRHRFIVATKSKLERYQKKGGGFVDKDELEKTQSLSSVYSGTNLSYVAAPIMQLPGNISTKNEVEAMTWTANGYRLKSKSLQLGERQYRFADYVGGFGYVISHDSLAAEWSSRFSGESLVATADPNIFVTDIPPGGESVVHTTIEAEDHLWAVNLRAGNADPAGSYGNAYDSDTSLQLGLEYIFNSNYSVEGILGFQNFSGKGSAPDEEVTQIAINGRYYFNTTSPRYYLTAGLGYYDMDVQGSAMGLNAGVGLDYQLSRRLSLEAAYNYHDLDESNPSPIYSTLQIGLRYLVR